MPRIPLIEELTESIPPGSNILVEFDSSLRWSEVLLAITTGWLMSGGEVGYTLTIEPPDSLRLQLKRLGLKVQELEGKEDLRFGIGILASWVSNLGRNCDRRL